MWRGKGRSPTWEELRRAASKAIDRGLETHSLEQLIDIAKTPCREAGLKAARDRRDKNAQLRREYHNMVMDLLEGTGFSSIPQHTGFYGSFFRGFFNPPLVQTPVPNTSKSPSENPGEEKADEMPRKRREPDRIEEIHDIDAKEWVDLGEDLDLEWVSVMPKQC
ncbi:hypothetical protein C8A00DRAFT_43819 [Chaetomidium leptoderma]|uniref:Uncharacterized protein n=1 Tax=Chaetomidium leptoderma TaxID=669021 RepID=A0AAN6VKJ1_9PEZI|nr:hypothetical protein C8A00DRAFT_43819 [Chaetomidium leptoderma]